MKSKFYKHPTSKITLSFLCLTFTLLNLAFSTSSFAFDDEAKKETRAILITTTQPKVENWSIEIPSQGEILPWQVAMISSKTSGINAEKINVLQGDNVVKGQVLVEYDNRILRAELNQRKADLALAEANLNLAKINLARFQKPEFRQTLSQQEFDVVKNQMEVAEANYKQAMAANLLAKIRLEDATVIAPEDGTILERSIDYGQVSQTGDVLFKLLRQNRLEWVAEVDASELAHIALGMPAQINTLEGKTLTGKVRIVSPQLSAQTRLGTVHVLLDTNNYTAVNSYSTGKIITGSGKAIVIPANAIVIKDGKTYIFKIHNNKAEQVLVKVGRRNQNEIEIISDIIDVNDVLALDGAGFLNDGDSVAIKKTNSTSEAGMM